MNTRGKDVVRGGKDRMEIERRRFLVSGEVRDTGVGRFGLLGQEGMERAF